MEKPDFTEADVLRDMSQEHGQEIALVDLIRDRELMKEYQERKKPINDYYAWFNEKQAADHAEAKAASDAYFKAGPIKRFFKDLPSYLAMGLVVIGFIVFILLFAYFAPKGDFWAPYEEPPGPCFDCQNPEIILDP